MIYYIDFFQGLLNHRQLEQAFLYISKGIVEAHGGKIWAMNDIDGKGATFSFSIPLVSK